MDDIFFALEPSAHEARECLRIALRTLILMDSYLLENDLHERTITHKLAEYLQALFPHWNVDCEYNRDGLGPKRVHVLACHPQREDEGSNVFPDVIVHQRGNNNHNILIIEAKKSSRENEAVDEFDRQKVEAFANDLHYRYGALIVFHIPPQDLSFHARFYARGEWTDLDA